MDFFDTDQLKLKNMLEGVTLKVASGDNAMMTFFEFDEGAVIPSHSHPHEQISYVLEGDVEFTLEGVTRLLTKGHGVVVRSNLEHGVRVTNGPAKVLDAWHPLREDYL